MLKTKPPTVSGGLNLGVIPIDFNELINKICGELPEGYQIVIECENGYGGVKLLIPKTDAEIDGHMDDATIEDEVLGLLEHAKHNSDVAGV